MWVGGCKPAGENTWCNSAFVLLGNVSMQIPFKQFSLSPWLRIGGGIQKKIKKIKMCCFWLRRRLNHQHLLLSSPVSSFDTFPTSPKSIKLIAQIHRVETERSTPRLMQQLHVTPRAGRAAFSARSQNVQSYVVIRKRSNVRPNSQLNTILRQQKQGNFVHSLSRKMQSIIQ